MKLGESLRKEADDREAENSTLRKAKDDCQSIMDACVLANDNGLRFISWRFGSNNDDHDLAVKVAELLRAEEFEVHLMHEQDVKKSFFRKAKAGRWWLEVCW